MAPASTSTGGRRIRSVARKRTCRMAFSYTPHSMAEQKTGAEHRQHARAPIELKVDYKKLNSFFADYTKNISKGGTFIKTRKTLPVGTRFLFRLAIPGRASAFAL